ncbi:gamma-glutamylcyclotransferase family protein [Falsiroseomonas sp.]|uniref:gamma-glutamylcyclotransferase family protein n=1 Tax=Falsiroseomonas sp. TaxID=2870721 RepID=UPI0034A49183
MTAPVFVYGTLLAPRLFARFAGQRPLCRALPARLTGWRRVVLRGKPYPTLRRGDGVVDGLLLPRLGPAALARLAAYEGASYALVPVRVATPRGPRRGRAWIAARWRAGAQAWPQPERI